MTVTNDILKRIKGLFLSLEEYFILHCKVYNSSWLEEYTPLDASYFKLRREGYLDESNSITNKGRCVIQTDNVVELFEEFWQAFPATDKWGSWPSTRVLRNNKLRCRTLYYALIRDGVKHTDIIDGLEKELEAYKRLSTKENRLQYMQACTTWLNNRTFDLWKELPAESMEVFNETELK